MVDTQAILFPFVVEMKHLTSPLNIIASDMIRDRSLVKKLNDDPAYFYDTYSVSQEELEAMRTKDLRRLFRLGLHPFLLVRFAGMMGILEYWKAIGAPGREGTIPQL